MAESRANSKTGIAARLYLASVIVAGTAVLLWGLAHWQSQDSLRVSVYLIIACLASGMKVILPSVNGTMSASFLFVLIGVAALSMPETLVIGCLGIVIQSLWHASMRPQPLRVTFKVASMALSVAFAHAAYSTGVMPWFHLERPVALALASVGFFVANTLFVAVAIAITEHQPLWNVWKRGYFWSLPVYLVGAAIAAFIDGASRWIGWQTALLILPVLYLIHSVHKLHIEKLQEANQLAEKERQHADDV